MTEKTVEFALKPETQKIADAFAKSLKIGEAKEGVAAATIDQTAYIDNLPEGITKEIVEQLNDYDTSVASALASTLGNAAIPELKKNKNLDKITVSLPTVGKDAFNATFDRERQVPSRDENNKPNGTRPAYGIVNVEHTMYGTRNRAQMASVKKMLSEKATAAFGK